MKFYRVAIDSIPYNSTKAIVKSMLEEAETANTNPLSRKKLYSDDDDEALF